MYCIGILSIVLHCYHCLWLCFALHCFQPDSSALVSDDPSDLGKLKYIDDTKWYLVKGKCFCEGRVRREEELRVRGRGEGGEEGVRGERKG